MRAKPVVPASRSEHQPHIDAAVPAAGVLAIAGAGEIPVMAAGRGMRMIVPITVGGVIAMLFTVIVTLCVAVLVIAMLIRALVVMLLRVVLRADQGRTQPGEQRAAGE
jgi:hypothetical protein